MAFFDKLNQVAKNIGEKTGDAIEIGKLNSKINAENSAAGEELKKIGEFYYGRFAGDGEVAPEVLEFCQAARAHYDAATEAQEEIERIKRENEAAQAAAAAPVVPDVQTAPMAAASPGVQAAAGEIRCPSCGRANQAGTKFCCECGCKLEIPAAPQPKFCPSCGAEVADGLKFCGECGTRMG